MHKNAQKVELSFIIPSKPSRRSITAAKRKKKEKKGKAKKKNSKNGKRSQNFDFCACPSQKVIKNIKKTIKPDARGRMASCCVANAFSSRLKLILSKSSPKTVKMSRKSVFCKKLGGSMG